MQKLKLSMAEIADATGESLSVLYAAIKAGDLETFLSGRRRFARPVAVKRWVNFIEAQSKAGRPVAYKARIPRNAAA